MSVSIKKMEGVDSVQVSLNEGLAKIHLKPENKIQLAHLRSRFEDNGFTPRKAWVTVVGEIISSQDSLQLRVEGINETFNISFDADASEYIEELTNQVGKLFVVEGIVEFSKEERAFQNFEVVGFKVQENVEDEDE